MFGNTSPGWLDLTIKIDGERTTCDVVFFTAVMKVRPPQNAPTARGVGADSLPRPSIPAYVAVFDTQGRFKSKTLNFTRAGEINDSVEMTEPSESSWGTITYTAIIDPDNKISEFNKENNNKDRHTAWCNDVVE